MKERCLAEVIAETRVGDGQAHHVFEQTDLVLDSSKRDGMSRQMVACQVCSLLCEVDFDDEFDGQLYPSDYLDNLHRRACRLAASSAETGNQQPHVALGLMFMGFGIFK